MILVVMNTMHICICTVLVTALFIFFRERKIVGALIDRYKSVLRTLHSVLCALCSMLCALCSMLYALCSVFRVQKRKEGRKKEKRAKA